ncbi:tRNA delta(2)-isopentenylpyrophosphate transferase [Paraburkholderia unamae]|uniref:hypothetical protein n=1 Tax=Paraburkholderia unamae TaxID=219649 RepID=UPI001CAC4C5F|nr:hypothetical protein [Paraburkholderia unamae]CAG9245440.1 tRNA delta(2)-isopentenylpyrophosphate transferase [Paraburkholderia unamae]
MKLENFACVRRFLLIAPLGAALGGCMTSTPIWDAHFGQAVRYSMQAQIIDPDAGKHGAAQQGVDGKSAASAMDLYDKSFQQPPTASSPYTIGVSGGGGGGGGQ